MPLPWEEIEPPLLRDGDGVEWMAACEFCLRIDRPTSSTVRVWLFCSGVPWDFSTVVTVVARRSKGEFDNGCRVDFDDTEPERACFGDVDVRMMGLLCMLDAIMVFTDVYFVTVGVWLCWVGLSGSGTEAPRTDEPGRFNTSLSLVGLPFPFCMNIELTRR